jgi:LasA protease
LKWLCHRLLRGALIFLVAGCSLNQEPQVVVITATPGELVIPPELAENEPDSLLAAPEVNQQLAVEVADVGAVSGNLPTSHTVQPGDTLGAIAQQYNTTIERLIELNALTNADIIEVGQVITLPPAPNLITPAEILLSNALLVRNDHGGTFDTAAFVASQPGYIRTAVDEVITNRANGLADIERLPAAQIVDRVSQEFGVDVRLLLALLEYRAGWLTNPQPAEALRTFPMISEEDAGAINREGLYRQLAWTANELNRGYYGQKYNNWRILEFPESEDLLYAEDLNAATVALQYFLHLNRLYPSWQRDVSPEGFISVYNSYFGNPTPDLPDPLTGIGEQPTLALPFGQGEIWYFTGGPHGGWGSGSAWASVDFAPPDDRQQGDPLCYTSEFTVNAVASGVIAHSRRGAVALDLDGDGNELTGWTIMYLHLADQISEGTPVNAGDPVGRASCEGGFSTATHMHIGRRYNGEWLPASCENCTVPPLVMSGWTVFGIPGQEYQGFFVKNGAETRQAEQGRLNPVNQISW